MSRILLIEDDRNICWAFREFLQDNGHEVSVASCAEEGLEHLGQGTADLVLLDVRLPGMSGLDALEEIRRREPELPVVVMTAFGSMDTAIKAIQRGAYEYLTKPIDLDEAYKVIRTALGSPRVTGSGKADSEQGRGGELMGTHPLMQEVFKQIAMLSRSDVTVLIQGSSGTGKELAARAIHQHSERSSNPFVAIDCARLPESLAESEFYGHERGAFTGATERRLGQFERAAGGTVLLDEVGELSASHQKKLLRFLEERTFERVGGNEPVETDIRILAATHRSLDRLVNEGEFREDLFFRLNVVSLRLPDLKDRKGDIPPLACHFLDLISPEREFSEEALAVLDSYHWPGNVRELRNAVEHAAVMSRHSRIMAQHLPSSVTGGVLSAQDALGTCIQQMVDEALVAEPDGGLHEDLMSRFERPVVQRVLAFTGGNLARAARLLGLHRATLRKKIQEYGLD